MPALFLPITVYQCQCHEIDNIVFAYYALYTFIVVFPLPLVCARFNLSNQEHSSTHSQSNLVVGGVGIPPTYHQVGLGSQSRAF